MLSLCQLLVSYADVHMYKQTEKNFIKHVTSFLLKFTFCEMID